MVCGDTDHGESKDQKARLKAQKQYEKYLGKMILKGVTKQLPDFTPPDYVKSKYYVRTGNTIVLSPDEAYFNLYSN